MKEEWKKVKLGEISADIQTGPFGSQLHMSDYSEKGIPVVMPKDMINGKITEENIARVTDNHVKRLNRYIISSGNILYARRGDVGKCVYVSEKESGWLCGTGCLRININTAIANPKFVFFQLQKTETIGWVEKNAVGATMLNLNTSILANVPLHLPPLPTQQKIASILSAYDDLIENNRRQIKLLEEAALKLYKEWFVKLNFHGHETTKIADGVPDGWKKEKIDIVFDIKYGKNLPTTEIQKSGKYPVYGANGIIGYYDKKNCSQKVVLITSRGNGSGDVLCTKQKESFVTNNSFIVLPNKDFQYLDFSFNYGLMKNLDFRAIRTGSAQPQLTNNSISMLNVIIPDKNLIARYSKIGMKLYEKIDLLEIQIQQLQLARDKLLPKLMNGEIEV